MNYFIMQTALLMVAAYFLGAMLACGLRRLFYTQPATQTATVAATAAAAAAATKTAAGTDAEASSGGRFERALTGDGDAQKPTADPVPIAAQRPASASQDWVYRGDRGVYGREQSSQPTRIGAIDTEQLRTMHQSAERADYGTWTFTGEQTTYARGIDTSSTGLAASAAAAVAAAATAATGTAGIAEPSAASAASDNLLKIRGIDTNTIDILSAQGFTTYAQIVDMKRADIDRISTQLGDTRRVSRENWIEQAAMLANGDETVYAQRFATGGLQLSAPTAHAGEPLSLIGMASAGLAATAAHTDSPLVSPASETGGSTAAMPTPIQPAPQPALRDELQRIRGIDAETEKALYDSGISEYAQIAGLGRADVDRIDALFGSGGRVSRENWIEQAQMLAKGSQTSFARNFDGLQLATPQTVTPSTPARPVNLADTAPKHHNPERGLNVAKGATLTSTAAGQNQSLRSVRSEAMRPQSDRPDSKDDLKRIRGIGVLIEKKLNSLGITHYEQIANWSEAEVASVNQALDFKGRVEREKWVEQARILASGGQTEFSRRIDDGKS